MGVCNNCGFIGDTHFHHIVPKSRGGSDSNSNLIEVCHNCHRKIQDAEFGGDSGLIRYGLNKVKDEWFLAKRWHEDNNDLLFDFILDFSNKHDTDIISDMFNYEVMDILDFKICLQKGKHSKIKGNLPIMINDFAKSDAKYLKLL